MKGILSIAAAAGICVLAAKIKPIKAEAWFSQTHTDITENALEMLEKENKTKLVTFYKDYKDQILKGALDPDKDGDVDKGAGAHYYSCATAKGKPLPQKGGYYQNRLGDFSKSARTMLEENYTCALNLYKNNKIAEAMYALGRAAHFIEDISCPVHTANIKYADKPGNVHNAFEKHANTISKRYYPERFDKRLIKAYSGDSFETAANKLSATSNKHAAPISNLDPIAFDNAVKSMVPTAIQNVMALLMKFYDDCKSDKGNYLLDGKAYTFKNEASGMLLTVTPKTLVLDKADKQKEQKITVVMSDSGTFALKAADGGYVSSTLKGYDYPKGDTLGAQFRAAALGKNRYRITTEGTSFAKVLSCTKSGGIAVSDFEPDNPLQVWILNK